MWKWIGGCAITMFVLVIAGLWYGFRKVKEFADVSPTTTISVAATPARVFASLANGDSLSAWAGENNLITATRHGVLHVGDTLQVGSAPSRTRANHFTWTVTEVRPGQLLALQMQSDSTGTVVATWRDSLVAAGDSTHIVSTVASPVMDSVVTESRGRNSERAASMMALSSRIMVSAFRLQTEMTLRQLKAYLERTSGR